jgi:hypothetical protein
VIETKREWSPEPWTDSAPGKCDWASLRDAGGNHVGHFMGPMDRRRIVAAMNACAGIPTEHLEAGGAGRWVHPDSTRRFDACLVACGEAGLSTEALESGALAKALEALASLCGGPAPLQSINGAILSGHDALGALGKGGRP